MWLLPRTLPWWVRWMYISNMVLIFFRWFVFTTRSKQICSGSRMTSSWLTLPKFWALASTIGAVRCAKLHPTSFGQRIDFVRLSTCRNSQCRNSKVRERLRFVHVLIDVCRFIVWTKVLDMMHDPTLSHKTRWQYLTWDCHNLFFSGCLRGPQQTVNASHAQLDMHRKAEVTTSNKNKTLESNRKSW